MPEPVNLALAFSLTPQAALDYFRAKGYRVNPGGWAAVEAAAHRKAFTVARVASLDLLQDIKGAMDGALADGTTFREFQQKLMPKMKAMGWWGKDENGVQLGSPHRLSTISRTNVQTSYMEGRWQGLMDNVENRPWIEYVAILDNRTRPGHRALNGKVFRYDDPFWRTMLPPIAWACRCRIRSLSDKDLDRRGITPDQGEGNLKAYSPEAQGYRQPQAGYVDPRTGTETRTDVGWGYDRKVGWKPDPERYTPALKPLLEEVRQEAKLMPDSTPFMPSVFTTNTKLDGQGVINQLLDNCGSRGEQVKAFIEKHNIKTLFLSKSESSLSGKAADGILDDVLSFLDGVDKQTIKNNSMAGYRRGEFCIKGNAIGFTSQKFSHIVIRSNNPKTLQVSMGDLQSGVKKAIDDRLNSTGPYKVQAQSKYIPGTRKLDLTGNAYEYVEWTFQNATAKTSENLATWIHELGHQVHFKAGTPNKPINAKSITAYGSSNDREFHAEQFCAWLIDRDAMAAFNQELATYFDELITRALQ